MSSDETAGNPSANGTSGSISYSITHDQDKDQDHGRVSGGFPFQKGDEATGSFQKGKSGEIP